MTIATENRNPNSTNLDLLSIKETINLFNKEDHNVVLAVEQCTDQIEEAIKIIISTFQQGGRLIHIGAGTSGRLGVLDAAECYPTFGVSDNMITATIAGGEQAMFRAQEGAEDSQELAVSDLKNLKLNSKDILCGIAASGRTPYVIGGLKYALSLGCKTIAVTANPGSVVGQIASIALEPNPGPEILTGSTRMKAGTCQKLILNMLSTISMVHMGKVYENLMIDLQITNKKLEDRAIRNIIEITQCTPEEAQTALVKTNKDVKLAILVILLQCTPEEAQQQLQKHHTIRKIIKNTH